MSDPAQAGSAEGGQAAAATTAQTAAPAPWYDSAAPETKAYISNKGWADPIKAVESYQHLEKMVGVDRLAAPKNDWKPEQWNELYGKLGRPETPDKYKLPEVKLPEGLAMKPEKVEAYTKLLHESGLSQKQVEKVWAGYLQDVAGDWTAQESAKASSNKSAEEALRKEWGVKYDANLQTAQTTIKKFAGNDPSVMEALDKTGWGNDPRLVKVFANIGKAIMEDSAMGSASGEFQAGSSAAIAEIDRLKMDKDFMGAFLNSNVPGHKEAVNKWQILHQNAYPEKPRQ